MLHTKAQTVLGHVDLNGLSIREAISYTWIGIDISTEEHRRRTGKDTEVPRNLRQLVIGLIQKTPLTLVKSFNLAKSHKNHNCNVADKGNKKITLHSFNQFKLLYYQSNTTQVYFISSPQKPDALECVRVYIQFSSKSVGVVQPHGSGTDF